MYLKSREKESRVIQSTLYVLLTSQRVVTELSVYASTDNSLLILIVLSNEHNGNVVT